MWFAICMRPCHKNQLDFQFYYRYTTKTETASKVTICCYKKVYYALLIGKKINGIRFGERMASQIVILHNFFNKNPLRLMEIIREEFNVKNVILKLLIHIGPCSIFSHY